VGGDGGNAGDGLETGGVGATGEAREGHVVTENLTGGREANVGRRVIGGDVGGQLH